MTKIMSPQGQVMSLADALALEDKNGDPIKWEEVEGRPGEYTGAIESKATKEKDTGKELPGHKYTYTIAPLPASVLVTEAKEVVKSEKENKKPESTSSSFEDTSKSKKSKY
jgi:hypothetical protein